MVNSFTEPAVEDVALAWLASLSYQVKHGPEIAPGEAGDCLDVQARSQTLLPKLLSGEIRVSDAERIIERRM